MESVAFVLHSVHTSQGLFFVIFFAYTVKHYTKAVGLHAM